VKAAVQVGRAGQAEQVLLLAEQAEFVGLVEQSAEQAVLEVDQS
jgi:hypothetical protein